MDALPPGFPELLDLFAPSQPLAEIRFADLDAATLTTAGSELSAAAAEVATAEESLEAARATLAHRHEALLLHANRALAYARVFAEADETLLARVNAIVLPRAPRKARTDQPTLSATIPKDDELAPRRRGRPRKTVPDASVDIFETEQPALANAGE